MGNNIKVSRTQLQDAEGALGPPERHVGASPAHPRVTAALYNVGRHVRGGVGG